MPPNALPGGERRLRWRDGWEVARLAAVKLDAPARNSGGPESLCHTTLITGGTGALGLATARYLVENGARHLLLVARTALPPRPEWSGSDDPRVAALLGLERLGASVAVAPLDIGDEASLRELAERWRREARPPIREVVHCAGVQHPAALAEISDEALSDELWAKVAGATSIERVFGGQLDRLVLYSSAATALSSPFLAGYTAANAFLDGLAMRRSARGESTLSIDWGLWAGSGMAARYEANSERELDAGGLAPMRAADALAMFGELSERSGRLVVAPIDWSRWSERYPVAASDPYLSERIAPTGSPDQAEPSALADAQESTLEWLLRELGRVLRTAVEEIDAERPLVGLGMDSLMALELRTRIERRAGVNVPVVRILRCQAASELGAWIDEQLGWEELVI